MKRMWSPWRSQYIQSFSERPKRRKESLFRAALRSRDDRKNLVLWRGKRCFVIMNRYPYNSGHLMIVPNRQVADVQRLTRAELAEIMQTVQRVISALDAVMHPGGYNFGANFGRSAGAGIADHVHFHVVPRWDGDTNFMPVLGETKVISEDMDVTWSKLRKLL
ncbi:MAG TPA: HIT domain-containing protein [Bacteroidota bacterium]|nr:HIT domain-containing protein [Bacteroidota bacterium]